MNSFFLSCKEFRIEPSSPNLYYGSFYLGPFENGQSLTIANALRRTLLSEISGVAITSVNIEGVLHEYSTLPGLRENVIDVLLNCKEIVLRKTSGTQFNNDQIAYLQARGPGKVRAADLYLPPTLQCIDPDQYICTLNEKGSLNMIFRIEEGKSFLFRKEKAEFLTLNKKNLTQENNAVLNFEEQRGGLTSGTFLPIESVFSPIKRVNYTIQSYSSETIYKSNQFIILEIWTNGSIYPKGALSQTLNFLRTLFSELGKLEVLNSISETYLLSEKKNIRNIFKNLNGDFDLLEYSLYKQKLFLSNSKLSQRKGLSKELENMLNQKSLTQISLQDPGSDKFKVSLNLSESSNNNSSLISEESSITELGLPFSLFKIFYKAKITRMKDLFKFSKLELQKNLNLDDFSLNLLIEKLQALNLNWQNSDL